MMIIFNALALTEQEKRQCVVDCAIDQLGKDYVYGDEGPDTFDCSGLVFYCYEQCDPTVFNGVRATTSSISQMGEKLQSKDDLLLADVVFTSPGHVGIYIGKSGENYQMIHAPQTGDVVKISNIFSWEMGIRLIPNSSLKCLELFILFMIFILF